MWTCLKTKGGWGGGSDQDGSVLLTPVKYAAVKPAAGKAHFSAFLQCLFTYLNNLCH